MCTVLDLMHSSPFFLWKNIIVHILFCVSVCVPVRRSTSTSSKYSINWVKGLGFVKMYHDPELDAGVPYQPGRYQSQHRKIDSILEDLGETLSQIPVQSQKVIISYIEEQPGMTTFTH